MAKRKRCKVRVQSPTTNEIVEANVCGFDKSRLRIAVGSSYDWTDAEWATLTIPAARKFAQGMLDICDSMTQDTEGD